MRSDLRSSEKHSELYARAGSFHADQKECSTKRRRGSVLLVLNLRTVNLFDLVRPVGWSKRATWPEELR